jgi:hypothetical protein
VSACSREQKNYTGIFGLILELFVVPSVEASPIEEIIHSPSTVNKVMLQGRATLTIGGTSIDTVADVYVSRLLRDARVVVVANKPDEPTSTEDQLAQGIAEVIAVEELPRLEQYAYVHAYESSL